MKSELRNINLPSSKPQANVAARLEQFRKLYLQEALSKSIREVGLEVLDRELKEIVPAEDLTQLASRGIRGEFLFCTPSILRANPFLLAYYRLLLGYSQKEFYQKSKLGAFAAMEERGLIPPRAQDAIPQLCAALVMRASELMREVGLARITLNLLDGLSLLTVGPQLRGSLNTSIGKLASASVLEIIQTVVKHAVRSTAPNRIELENASGRRVAIVVASDPDIAITEELSTRNIKQMVAIEVKGGADKSNIWNRLGEAEKSHQTAKARGFVEFWTIYNVADLELSKARQKSPTTTRFYSLIHLLDSAHEQLADFRERLLSIVGIAPGPKPRGE